MARPQVVTVMQVWMLENGFKDPDVAKLLTEQEKTPVSSRQVFRWRKGLSYPRPKHAMALERLSGGRVTAGTFAAAALKKPGEPTDDETDRHR